MVRRLVSWALTPRKHRVRERLCLRTSCVAGFITKQQQEPPSEQGWMDAMSPSAGPLSAGRFPGTGRRRRGWPSRRPRVGAWQSERWTRASSRRVLQSCLVFSLEQCGQKGGKEAADSESTSTQALGPRKPLPSWFLAFLLRVRQSHSIWTRARVRRHLCPNWGGKQCGSSGWTSNALASQMPLVLTGLQL